MMLRIKIKILEIIYIKMEESEKISEDIDNENLYADDDYLIELHRKFTEMKNQRKL